MTTLMESHKLSVLQGGSAIRYVSENEWNAQLFHKVSLHTTSGVGGKKKPVEPKEEEEEDSEEIRLAKKLISDPVKVKLTSQTEEEWIEDAWGGEKKKTEEEEVVVSEETRRIQELISAPIKPATATAVSKYFPPPKPAPPEPSRQSSKRKRSIFATADERKTVWSINVPEKQGHVYIVVDEELEEVDWGMSKEIITGSTVLQFLDPKPGGSSKK